ncbi:MAG: hypothetical protein OXT65_12920 [Alphaproteobacteria bacterium]|nr:hypothetical protein [Alphaproteobacteria bacterium]
MAKKKNDSQSVRQVAAFYRPLARRFEKSAAKKAIHAEQKGTLSGDKAKKLLKQAERASTVHQVASISFTPGFIISLIASAATGTPIPTLAFVGLGAATDIGGATIALKKGFEAQAIEDRIKANRSTPPAP